MVRTFLLAAGFVTAATLVAADDDSITISVPKLVKKSSSSSRGGSSGGRNRRPSVRVGHDDVDVPYAPNALVRWEKLPATSDGKPHTAKELEELRKPIGSHGYAAARSDLKPGHIIELHLVHPRDIPENKVTDKDLVIKYAVIQGETKPPQPAKK